MNFKEYWSDKSNNYDYPMPTARDAWEHQQDIIDDLKAQLTNMEHCYIDMKKERDELLDANTAMDRERNRYREQAKVYQSRTNQAKSLITQFFKLKQDKPEMTLMAVQNSLVGYGEP